MQTKMIKTLQALGFSEYEAKAYLALLENGPQTGYAVALNSSVPRANIYKVLGKLTERGDIIVSPDATPLYSAISPEELITRRKRESETIFKTARKDLKQFKASSKNRESIWNISGRQEIIHRANESVKRAKERVLLEIWQDDAFEFEEALRIVARKGVEIIVMVYGSLDWDFARVWQHDESDEVAMEHGGRWLLLSVDDREIVAGTLSMGKDSRAAWTSHPGLAIPITEFIIHDLYIAEMLKECRRELERRFGVNLSKLRNKFGIKRK